MKKFGLFILSLFTVFLVGSFTHANSEYEYKNLDINANILEDGTINVKENYIANFFVNKHGIIRSIPLNYNVDGTKFHIDISDINVEGKTFTTNLNNSQREIKIGDTDKTVIGEQTYPISYTTYGLIKNFSGMGYSELYWNLVGNDFDTSINKVRAVIHLPKIYTGFTNDDFLITADGTTTTVEDFQGKINRSQGDKIVVTYGKGLSAYQGITLSVKFPNGYFEFDDKKQNGLIGNAQEDTDGNKNEDLSLVTKTNKSDDEKSNGKTNVETSTNNSSSHKEKSASPKTNLVGNPEYEYTNLVITANILIDGTMDVKENFTANFFVQRHGMIRGIPLNYSVLGNDFHIEVSDIGVLGKKFTKSKSNGNIEIKIGDANETVVGEQDYPITYKTYGLIRNYSGMGYAELYWNLVGNDFDTNINNVRADIYLPKTYTGFTADDFLITADGITNTVKDFGGKVERKGGDKITIIYDKGLSAFHGITLSVKFPNNYFEFNDKRQAKLIGTSGGNGLGDFFNSLGDSILGIIETFGVIALAIYGFISKYKNKIGKIDTKSGALKGDFAKKFPVIVQYTPPVGVNSAEAGLLLHREAKAKDMLSLIYKWAAEGLITLSIEEGKKPLFGEPKQTIIITKTGNINNETMPGYEQDFFRNLVRSEKNKVEESSNLYRKLELSALESYGKNKGWFKGTRIKKGGIIFLLCFGAYILFGYLAENFPGLYGIFLLMLIFLCIYRSGNKKLKETEEGAKLISHILGYREFIAMCDENKLRLFLEQDPLYFDKILPYAVAFGLETQLIKKIEPIMQEMNIKSTWYNGNLNSMYLMNDIISSVADRSIPHYSSSGGFSGGSSFGGGFSFGGGGGGGGGRSW